MVDDEAPLEVVDLVLDDAGEKARVAPVDLVAVPVEGLHLDLCRAGYLHADVGAREAALVHHFRLAAHLGDAGIDEDLPAVLAADALLVEVLHLEGDDAFAQPDLRGRESQGVIALQEGLDEGLDVLFRRGIEGDGQVGRLHPQKFRLLVGQLFVAPELPGLVLGHMRPLSSKTGVLCLVLAVPTLPASAGPRTQGMGLKANG